MDGKLRAGLEVREGERRRTSREEGSWSRAFSCYIGSGEWGMGSGALLCVGLAKSLCEWSEGGRQPFVPAKGGVDVGRGKRREG